jgi:recombination protein RecR
MKFYVPPSLEKALKSLQSIPGIGERISQRFLFNLLKLPENQKIELVKDLVVAVKKLKPCKECGLYTEKKNQICEICSDENRKKSIIMVVEEVADAYTIEKLGKFEGVYHVLGGRIAPIEGINPEDLNINSLIERIKKYKAEEVIIATNPNTEGEATASYLAWLLRKNFPNLKLTRLSRGLMFGALLQFADAFSLENALKYRKEIIVKKSEKDFLP